MPWSAKLPKHGIYVVDIRRLVAFSECLINGNAYFEARNKAYIYFVYSVII